jgi:2-polyprenyl-3-methyl-5-hydroxy-6-metoxy-1,4-benzoquinol methylase
MTGPKWREAVDSLLRKRNSVGFPDVYRPNVERKGISGQLAILIFGSPQLGNFTNGIYLRRILDSSESARILDAGCGDGTLAFHVALRYQRSNVKAVDCWDNDNGKMNHELVKRKVERLLPPNLTFHKADLRQLPYCSCFDFIYCFDVLEHIKETKLVLQNLF